MFDCFVGLVLKGLREKFFVNVLRIMQWRSRHPGVIETSDIRSIKFSFITSLIQNHIAASRKH